MSMYTCLCIYVYVYMSMFACSRDAVVKISLLHQALW